MTIEPFWAQINEPTLRQGDLLSRCIVPVPAVGFATENGPGEGVAIEYDLIVLTQSCDLEQRKVRLVAACPIFPLSEFEAVNPAFARKGRWNEVLKGRIEGLHLLASPTVPDDNREALVVDFREIYSLPSDYLTDHAIGLGTRWRLLSPFLEHFSQAFARFFMRVGLPSTIPEFR
jgi:hypothetical protein